MKQILAAGLGLALAACAGAPDPGEARGCPPAGWDRARLDRLKAAQFEIVDEAERQTFAKGVTDCLAARDPAVRDGVAFEALAHMLRTRQLDDATKRALLADLSVRLEAPEGAGFERPFAALALSEVARADRIEPFLTEDERVTLLVRAQHWFINVSDYRGFNDTEGWRHAIAHGADLLMQLALNPRVDAEGLRVIVSAVAVQVAPKGRSYVDGESERLARPVLFAAARGALRQEEWTSWLAALAAPPAGMKVFETEAGLAWRHNTMAFLQALYVNAALGSDRRADVMLPGLEAALKAMP